jgi:predicted RecB family nuclease
MLLTDDLLLNYKRCKRRAFLDIYGDFNSQDQEQDFLRKLRRDSYVHQQAVLAKEIYHSPHYSRGNWQSGAEATLELMQQGKERIAQAVLLMETDQGVTLLSRPDLLVKQPGQSLFGDWMYIPTTIKLGRRPKPEYQIVATFSAQLLAATQGISPSFAWLILRRQDTYVVNLERWLPLMRDILSECSETLLLQQEPELFISRQRCSLCRWYSSCYAIAQANQHLSLLPGVTPTRYQDLQTLGISTVKSLATAEISTLKTFITSEIAGALVQQAQSTIQNRAMLRQHPGFNTDNSGFFKKINSLPSAPVELYFDIEAEPDLQLDYLLGVLVVDHRTNTKTFQAFLAENPSEEASIWRQFLDLVALYPEAPIFHFSDYEVEAVKRLVKLYKTHTPQQSRQLISRFVDLHQKVMETVTLPVESYSLKHLARWLGFEWRDPGITGSKCVCLYDQWLESGDRSLLDLILHYNEDDCRATYHLKNWLVNFLHNPIES